MVVHIVLLHLYRWQEQEAARIAELKAEAATFKKRQSLEQQRFRLRQEEKLLTLETEIAKSQAREQALALVDPSPRVAVSEPAGSESNPRLITPNPATLEIGRPVAQGHSTLNPEAPEWHRRPLVANSDGSQPESNHSGALSSPSERAFHVMLELHQQQNKIVEMLATHQKKSSLPHPYFRRQSHGVRSLYQSLREYN